MSSGRLVVNGSGASPRRALSSGVPAADVGVDAEAARECQGDDLGAVRSEEKLVVGEIPEARPDETQRQGGLPAARITGEEGRDPVFHDGGLDVARRARAASTSP